MSGRSYTVKIYLDSSKCILLECSINSIDTSEYVHPGHTDRICGILVGVPVPNILESNQIPEYLCCCSLNKAKKFKSAKILSESYLLRL